MSPIDSGEYKSKIGLDSIYIAEIVADELTGYAAEAPEYFAPAVEASQEPVVNTETQYADDGPFDVFTSEGETAIAIQVTNLPLSIQARVTGATFDTASGRVFETSAVPPYFALGFRSLKSNGSYRYYWFLKGRFDKPSENAVTRGETPDPQVLEMTYRAIQTQYAFDVGDVDAQVKRVVGDEDTDNFSATGWFDAVQTPEGAAPSSI